MLQEITGQEGDFLKVYDIWKDLLAQDEYEKLSSRHTESIDAMKMISENILGFQQAVASAQDDTHRAGLIQWLSTADSSISYNNAREKHQPETSNWLTQESTDFKVWESASNSFLWLNGKAGSGKTILSSSVIKHLKHFYGDNPQAQHPEAVEALHKYRENGQNPELDELQNALIATIRGFSDAYIVLDALDEFSLEASERKKLLNFVRQIQMTDLDNLHILCTSRREVDIEKAFKPLLLMGVTRATDVDLGTHRRKVDHDIGLHIDKTLASETYDDWPEELKIEARQALVERADGMFQYISCQFDALRDLPGPRAIHKALKDLPIGLDATYDRILKSIKPEYRKPVSNILKWLAFSMRRLFVEELAEIFIFDHDRKPPFDEGDRLILPESVLNYLPSLVTTFKFSGSKETKEVALAHFSIKEYLISPRIAQSPAKFFSTTRMDAHLHISETCLAYHLHLSGTILVTEEQCKHFALWKYAGKYWPTHLKEIPRPSWRLLATEMASQALAPSSQPFLNMCRIHSLVRSGRLWPIKFSDLAPPLYWLVQLGAAHLIELLLDNKVDINELSPSVPYEFALAAATSRDNINILKLLLDRGADINLQGCIHGSALQVASHRGNESTLRLLVNRGADINADGGVFGSALQSMTFDGKKETMQLLLDRGAEINAKGGWYGNALAAAAYWGRNEIIELLLDAGADVNAKTEISYGSALYASIAEDKIDCAELLISRGAEVCPSGLELENEFRRIEIAEGKEKADKLRTFQEDPSGYIAAERELREEREETTDDGATGDEETTDEEETSGSSSLAYGAASEED